MLFFSMTSVTQLRYPLPKNQSNTFLEVYVVCGVKSWAASPTPDRFLKPLCRAARCGVRFCSGVQVFFCLGEYVHFLNQVRMHGKSKNILQRWYDLIQHGGINVLQNKSSRGARGEHAERRAICLALTGTGVKNKGEVLFSGMWKINSGILNRGPNMYSQHLERS